MPIRLDQKMLTGFVREAQSYLPEIHEGIHIFQQDATQYEGLNEALRYVHTIKGAAAMVGLAVLSHLAYYVEDTLEGIIAAQRPLDTVKATWLHHTTDQLECYLDSLLAGDGQEQMIATAIEQSFRQLQALPALSATATETTARQSQALSPTPVPPFEHQDVEALPEMSLSQAEVVSRPPADLVSEADCAILADTDEMAETLWAESPSVPAETSAPSWAMQPHETNASPGDLDALIASIDSDVRRVYGSDASQRAIDGGPPNERYVLFTLAGSRYAIPVPHVLEIGRVPPITPVPNVPAWLRGVINLRGDILSVIDVRIFLGMAEGQPLEHSRLLVVQSADESLLTSLIVDQVTGIVPLATATMEAPQTPVVYPVVSYLNGIYEHNAQALAVFDLERFLLSSELRQFE